MLSIQKGEGIYGNRVPEEEIYGKRAIEELCQGHGAEAVGGVGYKQELTRDGAMPFSSTWHSVDRREVALPAVWLSAVVAFCMALTYLGSAVAFQAMVSTATTGLYLSYGLSILFPITVGHKTFVPGPFSLGKFSLLVGTVAVLWVATTTVLLCLPQAYPVTNETLNYTPVVVGGVCVLALGSWLLSARK